VFISHTAHTVYSSGNAAPFCKTVKTLQKHIVSQKRITYLHLRIPRLSARRNNRILPPGLKIINQISMRHQKIFPCSLDLSVKKRHKNSCYEMSFHII